LDIEVVQIVRRYQRLGELSAEHGERAIDDLLDLPVDRYPHRPLLPRVWELRANLTAYDAAYVALAEALEAPLLTRDARLARAAHRARVEVV
jgi:predicted nucleic acid-binding protein